MTNGSDIWTKSGFFKLSWSHTHKKISWASWILGRSFTEADASFKNNCCRSVNVENNLSSIFVVKAENKWIDRIIILASGVWNELIIQFIKVWK